MKLKKILSFVMLLTALIFVVQCASVQLPKDKQNYVGVWESERKSPTYMYLSISSNGQVSYKRVDSGKSNSLTAPIVEWKGRNFKVGVLSVTTEFVVRKAPYKSGGKWRMVVDGVELTRI